MCKKELSQQADAAFHHLHRHAGQEDIGAYRAVFGEIDNHTDDGHDHEDDVEHVAELEHVVFATLATVTAQWALIVGTGLDVHVLILR